jgi:hypothetical protein
MLIDRHHSSKYEHVMSVLRSSKQLSGALSRAGPSRLRSLHSTSVVRDHFLNADKSVSQVSSEVSMATSLIVSNFQVFTKRALDASNDKVLLVDFTAK